MYPHDSQSSHRPDGLDPARPAVAVGATVPSRPGLSWRHLVTTLLLLLTLPVWIAAALISLPVLVLGAGFQGLGKVLALGPATSVHRARSAGTR